MEKNDEMAIVRRFQELKLLVLGDVMIDVYDFCYNSSSRPSPERPDKKVYIAHKTLRNIGGAGNVAANLKTLGVDVSLLSICGNDPFYFTLKELCDQAGITHYLLRDSSRPTTVKTRLYIDDQYVLRKDDEISDKIEKEMELTLYEQFLEIVSRFDGIVFSDYNKGFFTKNLSQKIITYCNENKIPVIVDFKPSNIDFFSGADIVAPNNIEAQQINPDFNWHTNIEAGIKEIHKKTGARNTVITLGEHGICCFDGQNFHYIEVCRVPVVDPVGCGDTVRAALSAAYSLGLSLGDACSIANKAAAVVVQKLGTATVSNEELLDMINKC